MGRDSDFATDEMTATHATVRHLTSKVEGLSSPTLFDNLDRRKLNS
jgi:hypothetical protein